MAADASEQEHSLGVCPDMTRMMQSMMASAGCSESALRFWPWLWVMWISVA